MERLKRIKNKIKDKELNNFYTVSNAIQEYVIKESVNVKEIRKSIYKEIYSAYMITNELGGEEVIASGKSDVFFLYTLRYVLKHPNVVFDIYEKLPIKERRQILNEDNEFDYNESLINNVITLLNNILIERKNKYEKNIDNLSEHDKEFLTNGICKMGKFLIEKEKFDEHVKKGYIKRLSKMISFLDKLGGLQDYNKLNNERLEKIGLRDELGFDYSKEGKNDYKVTSVLDLKNEKALEKLSMEELTVLICFYLNRVEKTVENIEKVLFVLEKRRLLGRFCKGEDIEERLSVEDIKLNLAQFKFLSEKCDIALEKIIKYSENKKGKFTCYNKEEVLIYIHPDDVKTYKQFMKSNDITQNADLKTDVLNMQEFTSYKNNFYCYKAEFMDIMMYDLLISDKDVNWGYVEESERTYNGKNSIKNESENILIKADLKGFNNPISLHYNRKDLKKFIHNFNGEYKMPVYAGAEDFYINDKDKKTYMSNFILMPMGSSKIKRLKKSASMIDKDSMYYKYIKHLAWICSPKAVPEHLMKNGRFERELVDLESGDIESVRDIDEEER